MSYRNCGQEAVDHIEPAIPTLKSPYRQFLKPDPYHSGQKIWVAITQHCFKLWAHRRLLLGDGHAASEPAMKLTACHFRSARHNFEENQKMMNWENTPN
ncbi:hypothetical protein D3C77_529990 [compost metagenome]